MSVNSGLMYGSRFGITPVYSYLELKLPVSSPEIMQVSTTDRLWLHLVLYAGEAEKKLSSTTIIQ